MKKIAWITDSTCGLSKAYLNAHNIFVLPLQVIINHIAYKVDVDITKEEIYERLKTHGEGAQTSQPSFGEFVQLFEQLKGKFDKAIAVHASKELTGTYTSAVNAAKQTGFPVEVIDSKIGSYALGKMIKNGIEMEEEGSSFDKIVSTIKGYTGKTEMFLLPKSFQQMKNSGRVSTSQAIFASLLRINILLGFDDGKVVIAEKVRTRKKAEKHFLKKINDAVEKYHLKEICVMHAGVKDIAVQWKEEIETLHEQLKVQVETLVPVAGVHAGYGTLAVAWLRD